MTQLIAPDYAELSRSNAQLAQSLGAQRVAVLTALAQANAISRDETIQAGMGTILNPKRLSGWVSLYAQIMRRTPVGLPK